MERIPPLRTEEKTLDFRGILAYLLFLVALVAWHAWMTFTLFGTGDRWHYLWNDQPVVSGAHPQHLYLGWIGAQSLRQTGRSSCYDPAFQAGYPKTPVFNGSRFAEVFLYLAGGEFQPGAYKVGLAAICLLVPFLLLVASWGAGLSPATGLLATGAGLILWWGNPGRLALETGDLDLLLATLAVLTHVCLLLRFDEAPGVLPWLGLVFTGTLGWFTQPLLFPLLIPILLLYYLSIGARHRYLAWHLALLTAQILPVAWNAYWLWDWFAYWWLRAPLPQSSTMVPHRTLRALWDSPMWGGPADRSVALALLVSGTVGVILLNESNRRASARLLGLGAGGLLILAILGITWEPLGQVGTAGLLVPALWFAALPAAHFWVQAFAGLRRWLGGLFQAFAATAIGLALLAFFCQDTMATLAQRCRATTPLRFGLEPGQQSLLDQLIEHTGTDARILWEDRPISRSASRWAALLPRLTDRSFVGGLDPDGFIEHAHIGLLDQNLLGRPLGTWSDAGLGDYCRRYNIGWVVCWTPAAADRFKAWKTAAPPVAISDGQTTGYLFTIERPEKSFLLRGQAELVHADSHHLTLREVVPENGVVVLSLHHQTGLRAWPSRVQVEREPDANDPIGFIRLRVAGPVARVILSWDAP